jgi:hypothetical protein
MGSDDDSSGQPNGRPKRGRPQKPPVTIDLAANAAEMAPADAPKPPVGASETPEPAAATGPPQIPAGQSPAAARAEEIPVAGVEESASPATDTEAVRKPAEPPANAVPVTPSTGQAASQPPPTTPIRPSPAGPARRAAYGLAGLIGAVAALAVVIAIETSGILAPPGKAAADAAAAKAESAALGIAALEKRIAALESLTATAAAGSKELTRRLDALEAAGKATGDRIGKVESALATRPQTGNPNMDQVLDDLMARLERVEAAVAKASGSPVPPAGMAELVGRVATLESSTAAMSQRLAALQARPAAEAESDKAARALAIGTLRRAADDGAPFAGDLAMLQALGLDESDIAALRPLAEKGAPPKAELADTFPEIADRILAASAAVDPNAGFFDRLAGFARGLVTVRPTSPIAGETPDAVVSRMQAAVDHGDLARALSERDALPKNGKAVSAAWAQGATDRIAIDRLVEKLSRAAGSTAGAGN